MFYIKKLGLREEVSCYLRGMRYKLVASYVKYSFLFYRKV